MQMFAKGRNGGFAAVLRRLAVAVVLTLPLHATVRARAQDNTAQGTAPASGEKFKARKDGKTLIYLPDTVNPDRLALLKNQMIEVRGIISTFQGIQRRYYFTTDDGARILVIGEFPTQGGVSYWLRANVVEDGGKIALSEMVKWLPEDPRPSLPVTPGKDDHPTQTKISPLVIGGGVLILAALGTLIAMTMRNKAAEQQRLLEQQLEDERRRNAEAQRAANKGGGGPGGTVVSGIGGGGGGGGRSGGPGDTLASRGTIKIESGPNAPGTFPLIDGDTRIGRDLKEKCTVVLDKDAAVSHYHGSIVFTRDGRLVYEDKSINGSVVDGQFMQRGQRDIQSGSQIKIGATTLVVELFAPQAGTPAASAGPDAGAGNPNDSEARRAPTVSIPMPGASEPARAAATAVGYGAELEVTEGPEAGRRFPITQATTTIGREDRDILLGDASVSRSHAVLNVRDGKFVLSDDSSAHGTRVNDESVSGEREIHNGDRILLGNKTVLVFHCVS